MFWCYDSSINDHGYCAENLLDTMMRKGVSVDIVDDSGRYVCSTDYLSLTVTARCHRLSF